MNVPSYINDSAIIHELQDLDNQVTEELSKENVDGKKVYQLRFQQLMKGITLTQNPFYYGR